MGSRKGSKKRSSDLESFLAVIIFLINAEGLICCIVLVRAENMIDRTLYARRTVSGKLKCTSRKLCHLRIRSTRDLLQLLSL